MKSKKSQSLLDFIIPMTSLRSSPLRNREVKGLLRIWEINKKDQYGNFVVPDGVDATSVSSLISKGYLSTNNSRKVSSSNVQSVSITRKGRDVIRKVILGSDSSIFNNAEPNYEELISKANLKTASKSTWNPNLPDWVNEEMVRQRKNPQKIMNEIDAIQGQRQLANDPITQYLEKTDPLMAERAKRGDLTADEIREIVIRMRAHQKVSWLHHIHNKN